MNIFIGDDSFFYRLISGYARNTTRDKTAKYKSGVCACCGIKGKEIETAHKRGYDRSVLVKNWIKESVLQKKGSIYHINVDKFDKLFKDFTCDPSNFFFLCHDCHSKYDHDKIDENNFKYISQSIKQIKANNKVKTTHHVSTGINKEYFIHGHACSAKEMENFLQTTHCTVNVTLFYTDKTESQHIWNANKFSSSSSLSGNLHGGYLRDWKRKKIMGIKLEIK
ncbi:MAG: hypothetical protein J6W79_02305 [Alphaproteobacteria bacterium]|nr:hypothetical protein [Alphaproteobacteria bacterium]